MPALSSSIQPLSLYKCEKLMLQDLFVGYSVWTKTLIETQQYFYIKYV